MLEMSQLRGPSCSAGTNRVSHLVPITAVLESNLLSLYRSPCKGREGQLHEWECSLGETDSSCPKSAPPAELCAPRVPDSQASSRTAHPASARHGSRHGTKIVRAGFPPACKLPGIC